MDQQILTPYARHAAAAFPQVFRRQALELFDILSSDIDQNYRMTSMDAYTYGSLVKIPKRIHFTALNKKLETLPETMRLMGYCLYTRSTDGYQRHLALKQLLQAKQSWVLPFIIVLSGEYVVEIIQDIAVALPNLNRSDCINFVQENRNLMGLLRKKATSYWDHYYKNEYKDKAAYPGLFVLHELERWAQ